MESDEISSKERKAEGYLEVKKELKDPIEEFQDVFASPETEMGETQLIELNIETGWEPDQ